MLLVIVGGGYCIGGALEFLATVAHKVSEADSSFGVK